MVSSTFLLFCGATLFAFSLGRVSGRVEASLAFQRRMNDIIDALKKVEQLAVLKGEDISKLSSQEIVHRTQKQLEIKEHDE